MKKIPRVVGIVADIHYPNRVWIHNLVHQVPENGIVVATKGTIEPFLVKTVEQRDDLTFRLFENDPWELSLGPKRSQKARDWMFLQYIKYHKGTLFLFPRYYETGTYGKRFSTRIQDMLITAHQLGITYEVIVEET